MTSLLRDLELLVIDCQASGATPAYGDLLELGWTRVGPAGCGALHSLSVIPRSERRISRAVRELTGWSEACLADAHDEQSAWAAFDADVQRLREAVAARVPTVIHFARFELPFLRDLHERLGSGTFPLEVQCLHAIAARLYPDLPRRNIRALAGYLGHSAGLIRSAAGHVEASVFIWNALVPQLEERGIQSWQELGDWLAQKVTVARSMRRVFPLAVARRRALPDEPGVYRFVRKNGDVLYVGKATSIKKRIAGHFRSGAPHTERALELLTQVHDVLISQTASTLEAALLESDEIKALDPPYNVQLRGHGPDKKQARHAWFVSPNLDDAQPRPDADHRLGPLPSRGAVSALPAIRALLAGEPATPLLQAVALAVPTSFLPEPALFAEGMRAFAAELPCADEQRPARRAMRAALALWLERRRSEPLAATDEAAPDEWDLARVRRRLERNLIQAALLTRRARFLCLLADADVAYRELEMPHARALVVERAELVARHDLTVIAELAALPIRAMSSAGQRRACFDATRYDRLRVLATELYRVHSEGGELALRFGAHLLTGERLLRLLRLV